MQGNSSPNVKPSILYSALIGQVIERRRKDSGVSQEVLAKTLGLSQSAYSRLEQGQSTLTVAHLRMIAMQLRSTSAEIVAESDRLAARLQRQGVQVADDKEDTSKAGLLIALGILAALFAAGR